MDFLNHSEWVWFFYQVFLLSPVQYLTVEIRKRLCDIEEIQK
jgi:hypothetical protein